MKKLKELAKSGSTQAPAVAPKPGMHIFVIIRLYHLPCSLDPKVQARKARTLVSVGLK